jgi:hypothetical protein
MRRERHTPDENLSEHQEPEGKQDALEEWDDLDAVTFQKIKRRRPVERERASRRERGPEPRKKR